MALIFEHDDGKRMFDLVMVQTRSGSPISVGVLRTPKSM